MASPGGYGPLDALFETLTLIQTRKITPMAVVLVGQSVWEKAVDIDFLVDEGVFDEEDINLFWYAETADDIWLSINKWYANKGESLQP
ncbi:MAG: putative Rossmann-fold nucleotide-binding protein [Gammaproteobacteria bacterium]